MRKSKADEEHDETENGVPRFDGFISKFKKAIRYRRKREEWEK